MQAIILAGGKGLRLTEETILKPKPLVEIGSKPIIWHIMKIYSYYGVNDFIICAGYKGNMIKSYFSNFLIDNSDIEIDLKSNSISYLKRSKNQWKVKIIDTGENTMTGGRLKSIENYLDDTFFLTYGDGLSSINIKDTLKFHNKHKKILTMSVIKQPGRYGSVKLGKNNIVEKFTEKPNGEDGWINGGFFVMNKKILNYIDGDKTLEKDPLIKLSKKREIMSYKHNGFWYSMDSLRDKIFLENEWKKRKPGWKIWK
mgnify:CR=1 FL=1